MRASEIFGKEIKEYLARVNVSQTDDYDLARMIVIIGQDVEDRQQRSWHDLLTVMYGDHEEDEDRNLENEKIRADIRKTDAQADLIRRSLPK